MIYVDDDSIKIGGVVLPGIYKSIEVDQEAQVDEQEVEGSSKKPKQVSGYEDAKITIELSLMDSETITKETKLQMIQDIFRSAEQEKPTVHEMVSAHSSIRGIHNVIVRNLKSKETNKKNEIVVNLELLQYDTMTITAKKFGKKDSYESSGSTLNDDYKKYSKSERGKAPKQTNKTAATPAVDS